ncbi:MAG: HPF/RaiA family ribosome-associated protein [Hyphomicrobiales bacterium]
MQTPPQISFVGMDPSPAIESRVMERIEKLEEFHKRITSCRVAISAPHRHGRKGRIYDVRIDVSVPGGEVVVNREPGQNHAHEDVYVAIRDAFKAAQRQLEDHVRKHSGHRVKEHPLKTQGEVVRLFAEQGYGFITTSDGREFFFERDNVTGDGWNEMDTGSAVRFTEMEGDKGLHATAVTVVT